MKIFDYIRNILFVFAIMILIAAAGCIVFRIKPATVMSGSMEPTFHTGSVVLIKKGAEVKKGDPIAFHVGDSYVTHRIVGQGENGYITKGDANDAEDPWQVASDSIDGKVIFSIPLLGYVFNVIGSRRGIIIGAALLLCLLLSMFMVSGKNREEETDNKKTIETLATAAAAPSAEESEWEKRYLLLLDRHLSMIKLLAEKKCISPDFYEKEKRLYEITK